MTDIRSLYLDAFRRVLAPVTEPACCEECTHDPIVHGYLKPEDLADALAEAGLLPTGVEERGGTKIIDGRGRVVKRHTLRRRLVSDWREVSE
ncbi:hypothetical protein [Nocardia sp. NPDC019255]|uniref:hypothetical protein n=1 Tax=Nocardia sp. NPDC019255 TaxID=3154591 RepID=UPI0033E63DD4